jgi:hypothetical protein
MCETKFPLARIHPRRYPRAVIFTAHHWWPC